MISSDYDSNEEDDALNKRNDVSNKGDIASNKEDDAENVRIRCVDIQAILSKSGHQQRKPNFQNNVKTAAVTLQQSCDKKIPLESIRKPITFNWHTPVCEGNYISNADPLSQDEPAHQPKQPKRFRYPGDMSDVQSMSRLELERCVTIWKVKVEYQSKMIAALQRKVKDKDRQISRLRSLVKRK